MVGLQTKVDEHFFGYREVRHFNVHVPPNPYVLKFATTGNKEKAGRYLLEIYATRDKAVADAIAMAVENPLSAEATAKIINTYKEFLNADGQEALTGYHNVLGQGLAAGYYLALTDPYRIGETPAVAKGIHIDGALLIGTKIGGDVAWAVGQLARLIFMAERRGVEIK